MFNKYNIYLITCRKIIMHVNVWCPVKQSYTIFGTIRRDNFYCDLRNSTLLFADFCE